MGTNPPNQGYRCGWALGGAGGAQPKMPPLTKIAPTHVRPPSKNLRPQKNLRAVNSTNVQFRNHQQCEKKILRDPFGAAKMTFRCFVLNLFRKIRGLGTFCAPQFNRGHVPPCLKVSVPAPPRVSAPVWKIRRDFGENSSQQTSTKRGRKLQLL